MQYCCRWRCRGTHKSGVYTGRQAATLPQHRFICPALLHAGAAAGRPAVHPVPPAPPALCRRARRAARLPGGAPGPAVGAAQPAAQPEGRLPAAWPTHSFAAAHSAARRGALPRRPAGCVSPPQRPVQPPSPLAAARGVRSTRSPGRSAALAHAWPGGQLCAVCSSADQPGGRPRAAAIRGVAPGGSCLCCGRGAPRDLGGSCCTRQLPTPAPPGAAIQPPGGPARWRFPDRPAGKCFRARGRMCSVLLRNDGVHYPSPPLHFNCTCLKEC